MKSIISDSFRPGNGEGVISVQLSMRDEAKAKFAELTHKHFFLYSKQLMITQRRAKALLRSDAHWQPMQAILIINALIEEAGK